MNTGIQDAQNLAWKLARMIEGRASDALLDTYHDERHPVARRTLEGTDRATRLITIRNPIARRARDLSLQGVARIPWVRRRVSRAIAQLDIAYPPGPIAATDSTRDRRIASGSPDPAGRFVLFLPHGGTGAPLPQGDLVPRIRSAFGDQLAIVRDPSAARAVLVRPDGHPAWRADTPEPDEILASLDRLLGGAARAPDSRESASRASRRRELNPPK